MALCLNFQTLFRNSITLPFQNQKLGLRGRSTTVRCTTTPIVRRTANYEPPIWHYDFVQSLGSKFVGEKYVRKSCDLKEAVRMMVDKVEKENQLTTTLQLVDDLQRLGISYHFEDEISRILEKVYYKYYTSHETWNKLDLFAISLGFRLLRQHGYHISQEIFNGFKDDTGDFDKRFCDDIKGMLNFYEASYLSIEGEIVLDEARDYTIKYLEESLRKNNIDQSTSELISHALELPLHWRVPRLEARWFIEVYEKKRDMNPMLLELAKLDFNMVQAIHQEDLKYASIWWKSTCWGKKLSFARDRMMENFLWTVGTNYQPQFGNVRRTMAKVNALITTIDDVYDVYGTLAELEQFTDDTNRWDINAMDGHPSYMKICFLGFYNSINEITYETLVKQDILITPYLKQVWTDLFKTYLIEAKWYHSGYTPTLKEYMNNSWISISVPVLLTHAYCVSTNNISEEALQYLRTYPDIVRYSGMILRLADDLGTSSGEMERGDVPKSIQCYMHESGVSKESALEHIKYLISETWKKLNKELFVNSPFSQTFIETALNLARMAQCMYQYGDGHASQGFETKARVQSLLINPIQGVS